MKPLQGYLRTLSKISKNVKTSLWPTRSQAWQAEGQRDRGAEGQKGRRAEGQGGIAVLVELLTFNNPFMG